MTIHVPTAAAVRTPLRQDELLGWLPGLTLAKTGARLWVAAENRGTGVAPDPVA